jgi:hypothetical protein
MPLLLPGMRIGQSQNEPGAGRAMWNEQADRSGLVDQSTQSVVSNLVAFEVIQAAGVSLPLAPAKAFEWRLGAGDHTLTHKQAMQELRLLLVAQFLGLVEQVSYSLNQRGLLSQVLRASTDADELIVWTPSVKAQELPAVLGGSLLPTFPLFPSTEVQLPTGRNAVGKWLLENAKGQLAGSPLDFRFSDPAQEARFAARIVELLGQPMVINPTGPWFQSLHRLAAI